MPRVAIVTDSACCIPRELVDQHQITIVPIAYSFGDEVLLDGVSLSDAEFFHRLKAASRPPTTMSPSPGEFLSTFREIARQTPSILCVTIGARFSGTYDAASQAARLLHDENPEVTVQVLDSGNAGMAQGFVVLAAARAAACGADLDEMIARAAKVATDTYLIGVLDTLEYVARGGRVPRAAALTASLLQIKPILQYHRGEVALLERPRTRARALERLLDLTSERIRPDQPLHMSVIHAQTPEEASSLYDTVRQRFHPQELYITEFTQVMSAHTGPGLIGLAFYSGE